jgi:hypothetical protein
MARRQVAGRGDGLHIWRVAAYRISSRGQLTWGGPPAWVAQGLRNFAVKNYTCCELFTSALEMDGFGGMG